MTNPVPQQKEAAMDDHNESTPPVGGRLFAVTADDHRRYVVADSFDGAVTRLHEYMRQAGYWPRVAATPEDADAGIWANDHHVSEVRDLGLVIL